MSIFSSKEFSQPSSILAIEDHADFRIARLQGPIDINSVGAIQEFQEKTRMQKGFIPKHLLLDFKDVTHIDSATIAEVIKITSELKESHHKMGIINLDQKFRNMLEVLKMGEAVTVYPNEEAAIKDFTRAN